MIKFSGNFEEIHWTEKAKHKYYSDQYMAFIVFIMMLTILFPYKWITSYGYIPNAIKVTWFCIFSISIAGHIKDRIWDSLFPDGKKTTISSFNILVLQIHLCIALFFLPLVPSSSQVSFYIWFFTYTTVNLFFYLFSVTLAKKYNIMIPSDSVYGEYAVALAALSYACNKDFNKADEYWQLVLEKKKTSAALQKYESWLFSIEKEINEARDKFSSNE